MLSGSDAIGACVVPGLVAASWWGPDFFGEARWELWSRVRSGGSGCAAQVPGPAKDEHETPESRLAHSYLLLQADYARPLLLEQPLILFPRGLVEIVRNAGFLAESLCGPWRIYDAQIGDNGLVPGGAVSCGRLYMGRCQHSQLLCLAVCKYRAHGEKTSSNAAVAEAHHLLCRWLGWVRAVGAEGVGGRGGTASAVSREQRPGGVGLCVCLGVGREWAQRWRRPPQREGGVNWGEGWACACIVGSSMWAEHGGGWWAAVCIPPGLLRARVQGVAASGKDVLLDQRPMHMRFTSEPDTTWTTTHVSAVAAPDHNLPTTFAQTIPLLGPTDIIRYVVGRRSFFPDAVLGRCATIYPHLALSQCASTRTLSPSPALALSRLATDSSNSLSPLSSPHFPHTQTHTHTVHAHKQ